MVDPGIHAEMTILIRRENELEEEIQTLRDKELPLWVKRVKLADEKGMPELADEAEERVRQLKQKLAAAERELDSIEMRKSMLRKESRRPTGKEVARAEALVEQARMGGLVDPDRKKWEELEEKAKSLDEESGAVFEFDEDE